MYGKLYLFLKEFGSLHMLAYCSLPYMNTRCAWFIVGSYSSILLNNADKSGKGYTYRKNI